MRYSHKKRRRHHKKATHRTHRRRRSVGALAMTANSPLVMIGSVAVGFLAGSQINQAINMLIPANLKTQAGTGKAVAAGQVGLGALLILGKGKKSMIKTIAGGLLAGAGVKRATIVFKTGTTDTLGGYGDVPVIGAYVPNSQLNGRRVHGYGDVPVVGNAMGAYTPNTQLGSGSRVMGSIDPLAGCNSPADYMN